MAHVPVHTQVFKNLIFCLHEFFVVFSCPGLVIDSGSFSSFTGVAGRPMRSKAGELSLAVASLQLLAPCLHQLPKTPIQSHQKRFRLLHVKNNIHTTSHCTLPVRLSS